MIGTNEIKTGMAILLDGELYIIVGYDHVKPGKGQAFVRIKFKKLDSGQVIEKTFKSGEKLEDAFLETRKMEYLYSTGNEYVFMDNESYEQVSLDTEFLGDVVKWLKENTEVSAKVHDGKVVGIELPNFVELEVAETEPNIKGNTVSGGTKTATLETGAVVRVPLFVETGDKVKVDTRTGEYITRV
jgi:elongation factor P